MAHPLRGPRGLEPVGIAGRHEAALGKQRDEGIGRIGDGVRRRDLIKGRQGDLGGLAIAAEAIEQESDCALGCAALGHVVDARDGADAPVVGGQLLAAGELACCRRQALERRAHLAPCGATLDDRRAGGFVEPRVVGVHRRQRRKSGLGSGDHDPRAGEAVAPAREGGAGHQQLGSLLACRLDERGGKVGVLRGVVVAAYCGRDDLVLVPQ